MASKLIHPDNWTGLSWMEILRNLADAINERYYIARRSRYAVSVSPRKSYQYYLRLISRTLKYNIRYWYNHVAGVAPVANTQYFDNWAISWTLEDMLADIGDTEFHDYDEGWHSRRGGGGINIGFDSYRDRMEVLRQYYEMIIRMKEVVLNLSSTYFEGGSDFYHPWRDDGVYTFTSIESGSTSNPNGSRDFIIRSEGLYHGSSPSHIKFLWPTNINYDTTNQPKDIDLQNRYSNLYQWFPVDGYGNNFNTAPGDWPSGPFFGRSHEVRFRARAVGDDGTFPGPDVRKESQDVQYQRHNIQINYIPNRGTFSIVNGMPKSVKYFYHCIKEAGPDDLGCPYQSGTSYYEESLDENLSVNILFGDNPNRPANIDIPMVFGQGIHQSWNGYRMLDSMSSLYFVEVWDDGTDGALEFYEEI